MNDKECIIKVVKLANSMGANTDKVTINKNNNVIDIVDDVYGLILTAFKIDCDFSHTLSNGNVRLFYNVDGININLFVDNEYLILKDFLYHVLKLKRDGNLKNPFGEPWFLK